MSANTNTNTDNHDEELDDVKVIPRLPKLENGTYTVALQAVKRVAGFSGKYDIFEVEVISAKEGSEFSAGSKAKLSFKRDEAGVRGEIKQQQLAECLVAINGGEEIEGKAQYISSLRSTPCPAAGTKFRVVASSEKAKKPPHNEYQNYKFFAG